MQGIRVKGVLNLDIEIQTASVTSIPKVTIFCELYSTYEKPPGKFNVGFITDLVNSFAISYLEIESFLF